MEEITEPQQERIQAYYAKLELHKLLKKIIKVTKLGRTHNPADDAIGLDLGEGELYSCFKYEQLFFSPIESEEYDPNELQIDDYFIINALTKEIEKRYAGFMEKKIKNKNEFMKAKKKFAKEIFGKSIKQVIDIHD